MADQRVTPPARDPALAELSREEAARSRSSPRVRRLAAEQGLALADITGTGFGGRVRPADLEAYVAGRRGTAAMGAPLTPTQPLAAQELPGSRRDSAATMVFEVDATACARLRAQQGEGFRRRFGVELGELACVVWAAAAALQAVPEIGATRDGDRRAAPRAGCGDVAVAVEIGSEPGGAGLAAPVLRDADRLSLVGVARAVDELVRRARDGDLGPDDERGAALIVDYRGAPGALFTTPLLPAAPAALLTTAASERRLAVLTDAAGNDRVAIRSLLRAGLTYDARAIDAVVAARFLRAFRRALEQVEAGSDLW